MIFWKQRPWRSSVWFQSILFQSFAKTNHFLDRGSKIYSMSMEISLVVFIHHIFLDWQYLCSVSHILLQTHPSSPEVRLSTTWHPERLSTSKLTDQSTAGHPDNDVPEALISPDSDEIVHPALWEPQATGAYAITKEHPQEEQTSPIHAWPTGMKYATLVNDQVCGGSS